MAAVKLDTSLVEKKFSMAKATPDSIQSVSLWTLTHKSQCDQIVATWLSVLKTSKIEKRLTLFYICNEIVQTCRKKHAIIYKDAFKEVLRDAAILARDKSICDSVKRIFKIWEERGTYEKDFVQELLNLLTGIKVEPSSSKLLSEFNPAMLRESLKEFVNLEAELNDKKKALTSVNVELNSKQIAKLFKDRNQGLMYSHQIEDSRLVLGGFIERMEETIVKRVALIDKLECGLLFYETQYGDARMVTNAYRNFGNRIKILQKKLEDLRKILPDPASPVPSPPTDAPSPVDSLNGDGDGDNMEPVDMDLSDEEAVGGNMTSADAPAFHTLNPFATSGHNPLGHLGPGPVHHTSPNSFPPPPFGSPTNAPHPSGGSGPFPNFQNQQFGRPPFFNNNSNNFQSQPTTPQSAREAFPMRSHDSKSPYSWKPRPANVGNGMMYGANSVASSFPDLQRAPPPRVVTSFQGLDHFYGESPHRSMYSQAPAIPASNSCYNNRNSQSEVSGEAVGRECGSLSSQPNQDLEKPVDPFSILDKLLAQSRKGGNAADGGKPSLLDLLNQTAKHPEVPQNQDKHVVPVRSSFATPVHGDSPKPTIDDVQESSNWMNEVAFSAENSCPNSAEVIPKIEPNILSKVSDLKPDVFEVLKSIISQTKQPTANSQGEHSGDQIANAELSESPALQETNDYYDCEEPDLSQQDHAGDLNAEQQQFYQQPYDDAHFEAEAEHEPPQENINFFPTSSSPKGPLIAPKCFLGIYSHPPPGGEGGLNGDGEYFEPPMPPEMSNEPPCQPFPECEETYDNYYSMEDPNVQRYNPEVCNDFVEHHLMYNEGPRFDVNYFPPPPPLLPRPNYNFRPNFQRNHFNRNPRFPPRMGGFHNFPRQRFPPPRFPGRGFFRR